MLSLLIAISGGGGLLLLEVAIARIVPTLGSLFYIPTVIGLSMLEDGGLPTLQGSPDGWPIPTSLGWYIAAASWWVFWSAVIALARLYRHRQGVRRCAI
ncbi:hypothetical protein [Polaromonas hydrogenivorans]|uniref:Uncharacterized protein n=1 Tax=Polaromonas hydrogenivorans TaxID=335476 RepID=A0AAU7LWA5_9BURK